MVKRAMIINDKDTVAIVVDQIDIQADDMVIAEGRGRSVQLTAKQAVPFGHKVALVDIPAGAKIYKYGEVIGVASKQIQAGEHVHVHNIEGARGRGDLVDKEGLIR